MSETLAESEFETLAALELQRVLEAVIDLGDAVDPDLQSGVLSILFEDGAKYVVNSHRAARQIWMAAERQAWHFDYDRARNKWLTARGDELWLTLSTVLAGKLGKPIAW
jgi:CyaY protein